jgi:hypothetical protein
VGGDVAGVFAEVAGPLVVGVLLGDAVSRSAVAAR